MQTPRVWSGALLAAALLMLVPSAAAYLDPGTGAAILQWVAATFLGALFALKVFWKRITAKVGSWFGRGSVGGPDDDA